MVKERSNRLSDIRILKDNKHGIIVWDINKDFSTHKGSIKKEELKKTSGKVKTNKGYEFTIIQPTLADLYDVITRKPQIILQKDIGAIIAYTGINKDSIVVEAGTGTGASAIILSNIVKKVYSYEKRPDHFEIAKKNVELFDAKNVILKLKDITEGIDEKDVDLVLLDLPEPWRVVEYAYKALKPNHFLVAYLPNITQVQEFVKKVKEFNFEYSVKVFYEQNWYVKDRVVRPINREYLSFTAFLIFARKL